MDDIRTVDLDNWTFLKEQSCKNPIHLIICTNFPLKFTFRSLAILYCVSPHFLQVSSRTPQIGGRLGRTIVHVWANPYTVTFTVASEPISAYRRVTVTIQLSKLNVSCIDKWVYGDSYLTIGCLLFSVVAFKVVAISA